MQSWEQYWAENDPNAPVFSDGVGKNRQEVVNFWQAAISDVPPGSTIIDICSGAGAVFDTCTNINQYNLFAHDGSERARAHLKRKYANANVLSNDDLAARKEAFADILVSQFGIEYLDKDAQKIAISMLKQGGAFIALIHSTDGFIHKKYQKEHKQLISLISESMCVELLQIFKRSTSEGKPLLTEFDAQWSKIGLDTGNLYGGALALFNGGKQLISKYNNFALQDVENWFFGIEQQLKLAKTNIEQILRVALDEQQIVSFCEQHEITKELSIEPLFIASQTLPIGLVVKGTKC
jgi:hypothetical protein